MRVAFDVKGTLEGGGQKVHDLFKWFESKGCEMIIWSSFYDYAEKAQQNLGYKAEVMSKNAALNGKDLELKPDYNMDVAIDDRDFIERGEDGQLLSFLACNFMIAVKDIPEDPAEFEDRYGHLFT